MFLRRVFFFTHLFIYTLEIVYQYSKNVFIILVKFCIFCDFFFLILVHNKKILQKKLKKKKMAFELLVINCICIGNIK